MPIDDPLLKEWLALEAEQRTKLHEGEAGQRKMSENYDLVGMAGEAEFSRLTGVALNWHRGKGGDNGIDFVVPLRFTVGIKTARKPYYLICEEDKIVADIYVLAQYFDDGRAELLGWTYGHVLKRAPLKDFGGIMNRAIRCEDLKPMSELLERIMRLR